MVENARNAKNANTTLDKTAPAGSATTKPRYTADSEQECSASHQRSGRIIKLITVQEILDEQHEQKM